MNVERQIDYVDYASKNLKPREKSLTPIRDLFVHLITINPDPLAVAAFLNIPIEDLMRKMEAERRNDKWLI